MWVAGCDVGEDVGVEPSCGEKRDRVVVWGWDTTVFQFVVRRVARRCVDAENGNC